MFQIGDIVRSHHGKGVVVGIRTNDVLVDHYDWRDGHSGVAGGFIEGGALVHHSKAGWFCLESDLTLIEHPSKMSSHFTSEPFNRELGKFYQAETTIFQWNGIGEAMPRVVMDHLFFEDYNNYWEKHPHEREATTLEIQRVIDFAIKASVRITEPPVLEMSYSIKPVIINCPKL